MTAFLYGVQKKYSDDRGGYLAALVTYYGFLSVFPLLLAAFTVVAYVLAGDQSALKSLESHTSTYPVIGPAAQQLQGARLKGSAVAVTIGVLGLVWGAQGLAQVAEFTAQQAWNVPAHKGPGFVPRLVRGLGWYAVVALGVVASTFVTSLGSILSWAGGPVLSALLALVLNVALFTASFRILTRHVPVGALLPGAAFAGLSWTFLTGLGVGLAHKLAHSSQLYGTFASVLALLAFLYLSARLTIYGIEANVVRHYHLWPRSLSDDDLLPADEEQLVCLAQREARRRGMTVKVEIYPPKSSVDIAAATSAEEPTKTASRPLDSVENTGPSSGTTTTTARP